ncbi:uncharacterized protein [Physcomitrium patens]|uniref:uncharacterized protein isoform X2 n=1 Tax=Physcomitrium patens TaxID=3218 RepID=UPI000D151C6B|nr:uncharacterized protein LOC112292422 isoform X2 [Physcomitrium patens]|eukprot:XP_024396658.1 uncharacterized protein LOC112292422 isoform X2 [Physcomitrella patens]
MDVVGGVIVAGHSSKMGSSGVSRGNLSGTKRSFWGGDNYNEDFTSSLMKQGEPPQRSLRSGSEFHSGRWGLNTTMRSCTQRSEMEAKGGMGSEADLWSVLNCATLKSGIFIVSGDGLTRARHEGIPEGRKGSVEVKIDSLTTETISCEQGSINSALSANEEGFSFWASAPHTYRSYLLKPLDPFVNITTVAADLSCGGVHCSNSLEANKDIQKALMFGDSSLFLNPPIIATVHNEGEPLQKCATVISSQTQSQNAGKQDVGTSSGNTFASLSSVFMDGISPTSTRELVAPFFRDNISAFSKPVWSWVDPLRFLLRKELTVTDVGELGRIVLPKRDAEYQLPRLEAKEGKLLTMEDYNSINKWTLRWWPNNKSRMYILENTAYFVKYYNLREKDEIIVYKDAQEKLVIRGKKGPSSASPGTYPSLRHSGFTGMNLEKRASKCIYGRSNIHKSNPTASSSYSYALPVWSNNTNASLNSFEKPSPHGLAMDFSTGEFKCS